MAKMFNTCEGLTNLDLSSFTTEEVLNVNEMFNGCSSLNQFSIPQLN